MTDVREGTVPSEDFWISCYRQSEPSVHGKVRAELDEKDRHLVLLKGRDGVEIERGDQVWIRSNLVPPHRLSTRNFFKALLFRYLSPAEYRESESGHPEQNVCDPKNQCKPADRTSPQRSSYCCLPTHPAG